MPLYQGRPTMAKQNWDQHKSRTTCHICSWKLAQGSLTSISRHNTKFLVGPSFSVYQQHHNINKLGSWDWFKWYNTQYPVAHNKHYLHPFYDSISAPVMLQIMSQSWERVQFHFPNSLIVIYNLSQPSIHIMHNWNPAPKVQQPKDNGLHAKLLPWHNKLTSLSTANN